MQTDNAKPSETSKRADNVRQDRRMKPGSVSLDGTLKLAINEAALDRGTYDYRWVNDKGNRIRAMEARDWDVAPEPAAATNDSLGTTQSRVVDANGGQPFSAVLMRKRKDWNADDQKAKQKPLDDMDEAIRKGMIHSKDSPELAGGVGYTPGTNSVSRGR